MKSSAVEKHAECLPQNFVFDLPITTDCSLADLSSGNENWNGKTEYGDQNLIASSTAMGGNSAFSCSDYRTEDGTELITANYRRNSITKIKTSTNNSELNNSLSRRHLWNNYMTVKFSKDNRISNSSNDNSCMVTPTSAIGSAFNNQDYCVQKYSDFGLYTLTFVTSNNSSLSNYNSAIQLNEYIHEDHVTSAEVEENMQNNLAKVVVEEKRGCYCAKNNNDIIGMSNGVADSGIFVTNNNVNSINNSHSSSTLSFGNNNNNSNSSIGIANIKEESIIANCSKDNSLEVFNFKVNSLVVKQALNNDANTRTLDEKNKNIRNNFLKNEYVDLSMEKESTIEYSYENTTPMLNRDYIYKTMTKRGMDIEGLLRLVKTVLYQLIEKEFNVLLKKVKKYISDKENKLKSPNSSTIIASPTAITGCVNSTNNSNNTNSCNVQQEPFTNSEIEEIDLLNLPATSLIDSENSSEVPLEKHHKNTMLYVSNLNEMECDTLDNKPSVNLVPKKVKSFLEGLSLAEIAQIITFLSDDFFSFENNMHHNTTNVNNSDNCEGYNRKTGRKKAEIKKSFLGQEMQLRELTKEDSVYWEFLFTEEFEIKSTTINGNKLSASLKKYIEALFRAVLSYSRAKKVSTSVVQIKNVKKLIEPEILNKALTFVSEIRAELTERAIDPIFAIVVLETLSSLFNYKTENTDYILTENLTKNLICVRIKKKHSLTLNQGKISVIDADDDSVSLDAERFEKVFFGDVNFLKVNLLGANFNDFLENSKLTDIEKDQNNNNNKLRTNKRSCCPCFVM